MLMVHAREAFGTNGAIVPVPERAMVAVCAVPAVPVPLPVLCLCCACACACARRGAGVRGEQPRFSQPGRMA